jgi:mono/diheme cytochrome c family protein
MYRIEWALIGLMVAGAILWAVQPVSALPEYATRTGEACSTCHINPAGGGPRTLRGLLWVARGKPDSVPEVPIQVQAGSPELVGKQLYKQLCGGCHGSAGEGVWAPSLIAEPLKDYRVRDRISSGVGLMPAFGKRLSDEQLDALVTYVMRLNAGQEPPPEKPTLLPPARLGCATSTPTDDWFARFSRCGGN